MSRLDSISTEDFLRNNPEIPASGDCLLVVVEGEKTELSYLKSLCDKLGLTGADVEAVFEGSDPLKIVEAAVDKRKKRTDKAAKGASIAYKDIWCIFDTETVDHTRRDRMVAACKLARQENIKLALSAPCFEVWILLHFRDFDLSWTTPEQTSAALTTILRGKGVLTADQSYDKGTFNFDSLHGEKTTAGTARKRAKTRRNNCLPNDTGHWGDQFVAWLADGRSAKELADAMPITDADLLLDILNWKASPGQNGKNSMRLYSPQ